MKYNKIRFKRIKGSGTELISAHSFQPFYVNGQLVSVKYGNKRGLRVFYMSAYNCIQKAWEILFYNSQI